jgi:hypothetical protein
VDALRVVTGDSLAEDVAAVVARAAEDLVPWRDLLHDGPVPAGLGADRLARVRAAHLASRGWVSESPALASLRERDGRISAARRSGVQVVFWFETDLVCALAPCSGCRPVIRSFRCAWLVTVPNRPTAAWRRRRRYAQRTEAFTPSARAIPEPEPECRRSRGCLPISPMIGPDCRELERAVPMTLKLDALSGGRAVSRGFGRGAATVDRRSAATSPSPTISRRR